MGAIARCEKLRMVEVLKKGAIVAAAVGIAFTAAVPIVGSRDQHCAMYENGDEIHPTNLTEDVFLKLIQCVQRMYTSDPHRRDMGREVSDYIQTVPLEMFTPSITAALWRCQNIDFRSVFQKRGFDWKNGDKEKFPTELDGMRWQRPEAMSVQLQKPTNYKNTIREDDPFIGLKENLVNGITHVFNQVGVRASLYSEEQWGAIFDQQGIDFQDRQWCENIFTITPCWNLQFAFANGKTEGLALAAINRGYRVTDTDINEVFSERHEYGHDALIVAKKDISSFFRLAYKILSDTSLSLLSGSKEFMLRRLELKRHRHPQIFESLSSEQQRFFEGLFSELKTDV